MGHSTAERSAGKSDKSDTRNKKDKGAKKNASIDCGWGRILFAPTFGDPQKIAKATREEAPDQRDIVFYVNDPHVALAAAPQELFLDPSHTYRLDLTKYEPEEAAPTGFFVRRLTSAEDAEAINRIYMSREMVPVPADFFWTKRNARAITYFVAEDAETGSILGTVTGIDHRRAFGDPEKTSSPLVSRRRPAGHPTRHRRSPDPAPGLGFQSERRPLSRSFGSPRQPAGHSAL